MIKLFIPLIVLLQSASAPVGGWVYTSSYDKMREVTTRIAGLEASNQARLGTPYRGITRATLVVTKREEFGFVHVIIENGVISCYRCGILVKIDDRPASYWSGNANEAHSVLTLDAPINDGGSRSFNAVDQMSTAHQIQIEVPFYAKGAFQYKFITRSDLSWPKE